MRGLDFKRLSIFLLVGLGGVIYLTAVSEYFPCQVIPCLYNHFDNETSPEHPEEKTISDLSWSSTILWNENPVDGQVISEQYKCANEGVVVSGDSLNKRQRRLPNVLLIGAKKCGTGALKHSLKEHPDLAVQTKEIHFFNNNHYRRGQNWYRAQQVASLPHQLVLEGSPAYFRLPEVPRRVQALNSSIKLLLIVRDPVVRLISKYAHMKYMSGGIVDRRVQKALPRSRFEEILSTLRPNEYPDFDSLMFTRDGQVNTACEPVKIGLYASHLRHWLRYFNDTQLLVIDGQRFIEEPWLELGAIEKFLNIKLHFTKDYFQYRLSKGFYCLQKPGGQSVCLGKGKGPKHDAVSNKSINKLKDFYW